MMRLLLVPLVVAGVVACASDPRLDPALLKEDRQVIAQICFPKTEFITKKFVGITDVTVWGSGSSGHAEAARTIANEPVYMQYLGHPRALKWLLIRARESDQHIFGPVPDARYPRNQWTSWMPPVAVSSEDMLWHKLVYGAKPQPQSELPKDVWVRYREMSFGQYLDLKKSMRESPSHLVIPACGTS